MPQPTASIPEPVVVHASSEATPRRATPQRGPVDPGTAAAGRLRAFADQALRAEWDARHISRGLDACSIIPTAHQDRQPTAENTHTRARTYGRRRARDHPPA